MGRARLHPLACPSWLAHDAYAPGMADEASTIGLDKRKEYAPGMADEASTIGLDKRKE